MKTLVNSKSAVLALGALLLLAAAATDAAACSVCFGNPESSMTKGVSAGIWVMLACIGFVLASFAGVFLYWIYRNRHIDLYLEEGASN